MTRKFIAALLSLSLATTAMTTAPARATDDAVKIIAGIAAIGILSQVLKNEKRQPVVTRNYGRRDDVRNYRRDNRRDNRRDARPRHQRHAKVAPQACLRNQWTHRGNISVYGARCMERNARVALPRTCERRIDTRQGTRRFYSPHCLRQKGWQA